MNTIFINKILFKCRRDIHNQICKESNITLRVKIFDRVCESVRDQVADKMSIHIYNQIADDLKW